VQYLLWAVGAAQVYRYRQTTRRHAAAVTLAAVA
jgi:hypothetical protein